MLDDAANHFAAGPNHVANLVHRNLQGVDPGRVSRDLHATFSDDLVHLSKNEQPSPLCLRQRLPHDLRSNAGNFDIHLQRGDAVLGSRNLEIHVAVMIFRSRNVGQDGVLFAFLHQSHRNASHWSFQRHACIHQRE